MTRFNGLNKVLTFIKNMHLINNQIKPLTYFNSTQLGQFIFTEVKRL
ncbi:hypothetical protein TUM17566_52800 [Klebsiella pneumoniae]|nr:hypothetical protein TUM17555_51560 [Klebsiella pneumoniae]GJK83228.1 hypothetical protein TUM17566_52800 [Klebsiella pneumoniae]